MVNQRKEKTGKETYSEAKAFIRKASGLSFAIMVIMLMLLMPNSIKTVNAASSDFTKSEGDPDAEIQTIICAHEPKPGTYVITIKETCTKDGIGKYTCVYCNTKIIETRKATGHSWKSWKTITEAKCETEGRKERVCSGCNATESETIPKLGHNISPNFTVRTPATCTSEGLEGKQCTRSGCGYWSVKSANSRTIPKSEHSWSKWTITIEAKCETPGEKIRKCGVCGGTETNTIPKLEHNISTDFTVKSAATCETPGESGKKCLRSGCGYWSVKRENREIIPPTGHNYKKAETITDPTCDEPGEDLYRCSNPGCEKPEETRETDSTGHSENNNGKTVPFGSGLHIYMYTCSKCKNEILDLSTLEYCTYYFVDGYGTHTSYGHQIWKSCSGCGSKDWFGYETLSSCFSCTTPPDIRITGIKPGTSLNRIGFENILPLHVLVQDNEEDEISLYWLLDGKTISNSAVKERITRNGKDVALNGTPDFPSLSEGIHTIRAIADDPTAPDGYAEISFIYDNTAPELCENIETVYGPGSVNVSGRFSDLLSEEVFFRMNTVKKENYSDTRMSEYFKDVPFLPAVNVFSDGNGSIFFVSSVFDSLEQGCDYILLVSVKDSAGNEKIFTENISALCGNPEINIRSYQDNRAEIIINDGSLAASEYIITAVSETGSFTVSDAGMLVGYTAETDLFERAAELNSDSHGHKAVVAYGFAYGTVYTITAGRVNANGSISWSEPKNIICDRNPHVINCLEAPEYISALKEGNTVSISWSEVPGATVYDIEIDGMLYSAGRELLYVHRGLEPGSVHEYRVRGRNSSVKGNLSQYLVVEVEQTEELSDENENTGENSENPSIGSEDSGQENPELNEPFILVCSVGKTYVSICWTASGNGAAYEVKLDGITVYTGNNCRYTFTGLVPGSSHAAYVSACYSDNSVSYETVIVTVSEETVRTVTDRRPAVTDVTPFAAVAGKTYRVLVPLKGVKADSRYSFEISFEEDKVSIEDLFEPTSEKELYDFADESTGRTFTIRHENGKLVVAVIWKTSEGSEEGIMADFLVRAEVTGIISCEYR